LVAENFVVSFDLPEGLMVKESLNEIEKYSSSLQLILQQIGTPVFEIYSYSDKFAEMDVFNIDIQQRQSRRLLQDQPQGDMVILSSDNISAGFNESNFSWVPLRHPLNSTDPTAYSLNETRKNIIGEIMPYVARMPYMPPTTTPMSTTTPAPVSIYSNLEGNNTAVRDTNANIEFVDSNRCTFSCRIAQNQLPDGTVVTVAEVDPAVASAPRTDQRFIGSVLQMNSSIGILQLEYVDCTWNCGTARRRLLETTEICICKVRTVIRYEWLI
jgi:hypothetical protein